MAGAVAVAGVLSLAMPGGPPDFVVRFLWIPVTVVLALWWGRAVRLPQQEAVAERERADAVRRAAASERQRALVSERMAIGRDLHDALAGHVVGIAMQAEAARAARAERSATVAGLEAIRSSSVAALGEMRSMIDVLRGEADPLSAPPTLADLEALIDGHRDAGVEVHAEVATDALSEVPLTVSVAAYRIMQEALANAAKHAPGRPVTLRLKRDDRGILISVRNPMVVGAELPPPVSAGQGLIGVAERSRILGGHAETRVEEQTGGTDWLLEAQLPSVPADHRCRDGGDLVIRVLIVDDHQAVRAGLAMLLGGADDLTIVGEAGDVARRSGSSAKRPSTSCSWTCRCRSSTASRPPAVSRSDPTARACSCSRRSASMRSSPRRWPPGQPDSR